MSRKKWWEIYPHGTTTGDEEKKFFVAIARDPGHKFRTVAGLASETGLTKTRIEEIIQKYHPLGVIVQSDKNKDLWGYWETIGISANGIAKSLSDEDKEQRLTKKP